MQAEHLSYLTPTYYLDYNHKVVENYVAKHISIDDTPKEKAVKLYYAIRDDFKYNPYDISLKPEHFKASYLLQRTDGYCIEKALTLAACARAAGIPSRLGFSNVTNHIGTSKLEEMLGTNVLVFHGYTEMWIEGKWVKATPAFNAQLCQKLGVAPLEFDGEQDSIFQAYNNGGKFMEYLHEYGTFEDLPYQLMVSEWKKHYEHTNFFKVGMKERE
jgi:transglutaminase-like putative cysteine protease